MTIPPKLTAGDTVCVISPSFSLSIPWIYKHISSAEKRLKNLGLKVIYGKNAFNINYVNSSPVNDRVNDIHDAFKNPDIKFILCAAGGYNSIQLINRLNYNLIRKNPKIICGHSDNIALLLAIYKKTGLTTYCGPTFFAFGEKYNFEVTLKNFSNVFFITDNKEIVLRPPEKWSCDKWYENQEKRNFDKHTDYWIINKGQAEGIIIGDNLSTFRLLQGTQFWPDLKNKILLLEDDDWAGKEALSEFDRCLDSLLLQKNANKIRGLLIGRFNKNNLITKAKLMQILKTKPILKNIPVLANINFGHTTPKITFPIGGVMRIYIKEDSCKLTLLKY